MPNARGRSVFSKREVNREKETPLRERISEGNRVCFSRGGGKNGFDKKKSSVPKIGNREGRFHFFTENTRPDHLGCKRGGERRRTALKNTLKKGASSTHFGGKNGSCRPASRKRKNLRSTDEERDLYLLGEGRPFPS